MDRCVAFRSIWRSPPHESSRISAGRRLFCEGHLKVVDMPNEIQEDLDRPVIVRSGGQGIVVDLVTWIIGRVARPREFRIDINGLSLQGFFGNIRTLPWENVGSFRMTPQSGAPHDWGAIYINPVSEKVTSSIPFIPICFLHFGLERFLITLNVFRLEAMLRNQLISDEQIVSTVLQATRQSLLWQLYPGSAQNWSLFGSELLWSLIGVTGRYRPHLVGTCIDIAGVSPLLDFMVMCGSADKAIAFFCSGAETSWKSPLERASIDWTSTHWTDFKESIETAIMLCNAERLARHSKKGKQEEFFPCRSRKEGHAVVNGIPLDCESLIDAGVSIAEAINRLNLDLGSCLVLYDGAYPLIGQGLIWMKGDAAVWFWVEKSFLRRNGMRDWRIEDFMNGQLVGIEFHEHQTHVAYWRADATNWTDRVFFT